MTGIDENIVGTNFDTDFVYWEDRQDMERYFEYLSQRNAQEYEINNYHSNFTLAKGQTIAINYNGTQFMLRWDDEKSNNINLPLGSRVLLSEDKSEIYAIEINDFSYDDPLDRQYMKLGFNGGEETTFEDLANSVTSKQALNNVREQKGLSPVMLGSGLASSTVGEIGMVTGGVVFAIGATAVTYAPDIHNYLSPLYQDKAAEKIEALLTKRNLDEVTERLMDRFMKNGTSREAAKNILKELGGTTKFLSKVIAKRTDLFMALADDDTSLTSALMQETLYDEAFRFAKPFVPSWVGNTMNKVSEWGSKQFSRFTGAGGQQATATAAQEAGEGLVNGAVRSTTQAAAGSTSEVLKNISIEAGETVQQAAIRANAGTKTLNEAFAAGDDIAARASSSVSQVADDGLSLVDDAANVLDDYARVAFSNADEGIGLLGKLAPKLAKAAKGLPILGAGVAIYEGAKTMNDAAEYDKGSIERKKGHTKAGVQVATDLALVGAGIAFPPLGLAMAIGYAGYTLWTGKSPAEELAEATADEIYGQEIPAPWRQKSADEASPQATSSNETSLENPHANIIVKNENLANNNARNYASINIDEVVSNSSGLSDVQHREALEFASSCRLGGELTFSHAAMQDLGIDESKFKENPLKYYYEYKKLSESYSRV